MPIYKTTQRVKKGFREMHDRMNDAAAGTQHSPDQQTQSPNGPGKKSVGEYIDFEEIK